MHIIELNDRNVLLRNPDEILVQSPGFANIVDKTPVFGEEARKVARLHPRQTFTQFWSQLSLDPLVNTNNHFRHQADLAFAHLNDIAGQHELKDEVIFAVPSNYNRNQLSILLGLVQSCEFDAAGLVDLPLLMAGSADHPELTVYLDIQLHQSVLTTFTSGGGKIARDKVVQIPGTGLLALHDAWANMVTDEFIKQSRFDPHHNAETEQYVYNQLEAWINHTLSDNEILMEINNKGSVFQARVNKGHFEQRARNIYGRIKTELETLAGNDYQLLLPESHSALPGLDLYLKNLSGVRDALAIENCMAHLEHIQGDPGSLSFITSLPSGNVSTRETTAKVKPAGNVPSHVLVNNRAYALPAALQFGQINGNSPLPAGTIQLPSDASGSLKISRSGQEVMFEYEGDTPIELNGSQAGGKEPLKLGDTISLPGSTLSLQLIQVE